MKVSEFLNNDVPPFLLGAFFGRYEFTDGDGFIYTYSTYRNCTRVYDNYALCQSSKHTFIDQANKISYPYSYWQIGNSLYPRANIVFSLENDLGLTKENFFDRLNSKIFACAFIKDKHLTEEQKMFIRGFCELRASLDMTRKYLSMDYVTNFKQDADRSKILTANLNVPSGVINYNFRENQPEFKAGKKRATQVRPDIFWYVSNIGLINEYRVEAFKHNFPNMKANKVGVVTFFH